MHVYIKRKDEPSDSGWVCRVADDADLTCFEFYVLNGMWSGLFVGGIVEIQWDDRIVEGEFEVVVDHPEVLAYVEYHRQQCMKHGRHIPYNELNDDEPF